MLSGDIFGPLQQRVESIDEVVKKELNRVREIVTAEATIEAELSSTVQFLMANTKGLLSEVDQMERRSNDDCNSLQKDLHKLRRQHLTNARNKCSETASVSKAVNEAHPFLQAFGGKW